MKFSRCSTIILMDSMESILRDGNRVVDPTKMGRVIGKYVRMFSVMASGWKRVIYLSSPDAAYWDIIDRERYDWARDKLISLAQGVGIVVIDSTPLLREMRPYRDLEDPRRTTWARHVDYGPSGHWRYVVHVVLSVARYVCVPDDLRHGLGSIPMSPNVEGLPRPCPVGKPAVVLLHEPMRIFVSADRFLLPPHMVVLMMEESCGYVCPGDISVTECPDLEPDGVWVCRTEETGTALADNNTCHP